MWDNGVGLCTETPCVIVNVQRGGPSTGLPTLGAQGDMMQARWGSHGPYEIIALAPMSPQEIFYQTIEAFNLSETYRLPVLVMTDEIVGHMSERVVIPDAKKIKTVFRKKPSGSKEGFRPFLAGPDGIAPMPAAGEGYRVHITGLTHDEQGYPAMHAEAHAAMVSRITEKIRNSLDAIVRTESFMLDDADIVIVSYGCSARTAFAAVEDARRAGIKAGMLRLITVWPFPEKQISAALQYMLWIIAGVALSSKGLQASLQTAAGTNVIPTATVRLRNTATSDEVTDAATGDGAKTQPPAVESEASAKVVLSESAAALKSAATSVKGDFDAEKVERIGKAIDDGTFKVNAGAIADKLIANAQELLNKPSH